MTRFKTRIIVFLLLLSQLAGAQKYLRTLDLLQPTLDISLEASKHIVEANGYIENILESLNMGKTDSSFSMSELKRIAHVTEGLITLSQLKIEKAIDMAENASFQANDDGFQNSEKFALMSREEFRDAAKWLYAARLELGYAQREDRLDEYMPHINSAIKIIDRGREKIRSAQENIRNSARWLE